MLLSQARLNNAPFKKHTGHGLLKIKLFMAFAIAIATLNAFSESTVTLAKNLHFFTSFRVVKVLALFFIYLK